MGQTTTSEIKYSIVLPVKDEVENLEPLLEEIEIAMQAQNNPWEVICVDDGSIDGSLELLKKLVAYKKYLRLLSFTKNFGQSSAFAAGFKQAKGEFVITLDADRQNDPRDIPQLIEAIQEADLVVGWRVERKDPWNKRMISKLSNKVRSKLCQDGVHDTGCSLKIYRKTALAEIKLYHGMHRFLPALFLIEGFRVKEIPVRHRERLKGKTKYRFFNRFLGPIFDMLVVNWMLRRRLKHKIRETIG